MIILGDSGARVCEIFINHAALATANHAFAALEILAKWLGD